MFRSSILYPSMLALSILFQGCGPSENNLSSENTPPDYQLTKLEDALAASQKGTTTVAKVDLASAFFLGTPYGAGLGEGDLVGPLFRADVFNCTTLIETALALANSKNFDQFKQMMNIVRYKDGEVGLLTRNHFPDADWIKNNQALGFFEESTANIAAQASIELKTSMAVIDRQTWFREFWETETKFQPENTTLPYILHSAGQRTLFSDLIYL